MAMQNIDRMALNAAIERLISAEDKDWVGDASEVINFAMQLEPVRGSRYMETIRSDSTTDSVVTTGYAAGFGNVALKEDNKAKLQVTTSAEAGRIGSYRIVHYGKAQIVRIRHFQEMPPHRFYSTEEFKPNGFALCYDGLKPDIFCIVETQAVMVRPRIGMWLRSVLRDCYRMVRAILECRPYVPMRRIYSRLQNRSCVLYSANSTIKVGAELKDFP